MLRCVYVTVKHLLQLLMSKRTVFTNVTALPSGVTRQSVIESLYDHLAMIDLNPLVEQRRSIKPPAHATPEEYHCRWYQVTNKIKYLPGGLYSGRVTCNACFHNLTNGLQTHLYAPLGLNVMGKWTVGGALPGEPKEAIELGLGMPMNGLWLREDVNMKCNILTTNFVKKILMKAHARLVDRLIVKAQLSEMRAYEAQMWRQKLYLPLNLPTSPELQAVISSRESPAMESTDRSPAVDVDHPNGNARLTNGGLAPNIPRRSDLRRSVFDNQHRPHFSNTPITHSCNVNRVFELEA
jgi:hypothetical protein